MFFQNKKFSNGTLSFESKRGGRNKYSFDKSAGGKLKLLARNDREAESILEMSGNIVRDRPRGFLLIDVIEED